MQIAKRLLGVAAGAPRVEGHRCLCCGRCCESFGGHLNASRPDLARWRRLGRTDLLRRVSAVGWISDSIRRPGCSSGPARSWSGWGRTGSSAPSRT